MAASNLMLVASICLVFSLISFALANGPNGECNPNGSCDSGQCCSNSNFCGTGDAYCGSSNCKSQCPGGRHCFPGDALVELPHGVYKHMIELSIGDKVAVSKNARETVFEPIYVFGHKDSTVYGEFVSLELESMDGLKLKKFLELTSGHFVQVVLGPAILNKRSMDVKIGDIMLASANNYSGVSNFNVTDVSKVWKEGLYNPYTMSGTILVNDVFASAHSEWFLDAALDMFGLTNWLPGVYQVILFPLRVFYLLVGDHVYATLYDKLDSLVNVAEVGRKHAGSIIGTVVATTSLVAYYAFISKKLKSY